MRARGVGTLGKIRPGILGPCLSGANRLPGLHWQSQASMHFGLVVRLADIIARISDMPISLLPKVLPWHWAPTVKVGINAA